MLAYKEFIYRDLLSGFIFVQFAIDLYAADFARRFFVSLSLRIFLVLFHKSFIIGQLRAKTRVILESRRLYNLGRIKPILHCI